MRRRRCRLANRHRRCAVAGGTRVGAESQMASSSARPFRTTTGNTPLRTVVRRIDMGEIHKVVLAREVTVECDRPIVLPTVLRRLRALFPVVHDVSGRRLHRRQPRDPRATARRHGRSPIRWPVPVPARAILRTTAGSAMRCWRRRRTEWNTTSSSRPSLSSAARASVPNSTCPTRLRLIPLRNVLAPRHPPVRAGCGTRRRTRSSLPASSTRLRRSAARRPTRALRILAELEPAERTGSLRGPGRLDRQARRRGVRCRHPRRAGRRRPRQLVGRCRHRRRQRRRG